MAVFEIWGKGVNQSDFQRMCEINQIVTTETDNTRDQIAALVASRWLEQNGDGIIEFRNAAGAVLIRLAQP